MSICMFNTLAAAWPAFTQLFSFFCNIVVLYPVPSHFISFLPDHLIGGPLLHNSDFKPCSWLSVLAITVL